MLSGTRCVQSTESHNASQVQLVDRVTALDAAYIDLAAERDRRLEQWGRIEQEAETHARTLGVALDLP